MRRGGFTLTEVLVVIAIISVLAGILFPVFGAVKNRSKHAVCADNLHQLGEAEHIYANDHDGWVPPATTAINGFLVHFDADDAVVNASPQVLRTALDAFVKSKAIWFCPTDRYAHQRINWLGQFHAETSYFFYPLTENERKRWPPRMQLMRDRLSTLEPAGEDVPLISDATGIPDLDSDPSLATRDHRAYSNHPDRMVNFIRHDLSLQRKPASWMLGTKED